MNVEPRQGAATQSWRKANPRKLLAKILGETSSPDDLKVVRWEFDKALKESILYDEYMETIQEYWLENNYNALRFHLGKTERALAKKQREARVSDVAESLKQKIKERAAIMLLDMMMPNGKAVKDCTGRECKKLSETVGVWLRHVSTRVPANKKVGEVLSEDQLQALYGA